MSSSATGQHWRSREAQAAAVEQWQTAFQAATDATDVATGVEILQRAVGTLPADLLTLLLKSMAEQAIAQQKSNDLFRAVLSQALKTAAVDILECRRHLTPQQ